MKKLTSLGMFIFILVNVHATCWRLNNNTSIDADFRTFAEAQDAASPGDTIYFEGNGEQSNYGNLVITKKLVLIGPGYFLSENDSTSANQLYARILSAKVMASAAGTEIYGLYIYTSDANTNCLVLYASDVIISRNCFYLNSYNNIVIAGNVENIMISQNYTYEIIANATLTNGIIANNYISYRINLNNTSSAIITNNVVGSNIQNVYNSQIKNNIVYGNSGQSTLSATLTGNTVSYNLTLGPLGAGTYGPGNVGSVDMSTVFLGYPNQGSYSTDGRFQLNPAGPAIGAGEGGIDCGMFGGSLPYVLSCLPAVPHIYEAIVPTAGSSSSGLPVIIKVKSQN
jgi:hypothetical protein